MPPPCPKGLRVHALENSGVTQDSTTVLSFSRCYGPRTSGHTLSLDGSFAAPVSVPLSCPLWLTGFCYVLVYWYQGNKEYYYLGGVNGLRFIHVHGAKQVCVEAEDGPEGSPSLSISHRIEKIRQQSASVRRGDE